MKIGLDLTWVTIDNQCGGVFQYGLRLVTALSIYSDNLIIAIISEGCESLFDHLRAYDNFHLVTKNYSSLLESIVLQEGIEVIHTPIQHHVNYTLSVPMITSLHDLQPFHFPEFFTPEEREARNTYYRRSAEFSERVIVSFQHVKDDIVRFYDIPPEKIDVCFQGMPEIKPVIPDHIEAIKHKYGLPDKYLFYSANIWRHKNHIGLLRGLKLLHEKYDISIQLICTGYQYPDYFPEVESVVKELELSDKVRFLGYLPEEDMPVILSGATLVVIPTLYEAGSYSLMEAMVLGVPVICSSTTSLPDTIGDLRFVFDPNSQDEMAEKMALMLTDEHLCKENVVNSREKVREATWARGVNSFEASYRKAIDDFAEKRQNRWYSDWAANYEFLENEKKQQLVEEVIHLRTLASTLESERAICTEHVAASKRAASILDSSLSWRITKPLRWVGDKVRKLLLSIGVFRRKG